MMWNLPSLNAQPGLVLLLSLTLVSYASGSEPYMSRLAPLTMDGQAMSDLKITLDEIDISIRQARFWRDWMPEVDDPGPDGGSRLYTEISLELENRGSSEARLSFVALLHTGENTSNPITLDAVSIGNNTDWPGKLEAGEIRLILLRGRTGPHVPVDKTIWCEIIWQDHNGNRASVATKQQRVMRID
jgi:hypothetical protein